MSKTVVILGAGWAGLPLAHKLLKYTVPKLSQLKVILVTPNSHFFWNVAATRGMIPGEISNEELFLPIAPAFASYSPENFELVLGKAEGLDIEGSKVAVRMTKDGSHRDIAYDEVVVASGSSMRGGIPLKHVGAQDQMAASWKDLQDKVANAKSILISGGGPTSVEVAGELAARYKDKDITLVLSGSKPVTSAITSVQDIVDKDLQKLGVKLIRNARVANTTTSSDGKQTEVSLSNNQTISVDLYLPLHGSVPNTSFLPHSLLDESGNLKLDSYMRASGTKTVWGIGDVGDLEPKQLTVTDNQIVYLAGALDAALTGSGKVAEYKKMDKTMIFVSLGRRFASGQIGGWRLFGWMVNLVKGRKLFVDTARGYVDGKHLRHAAM
ncbi:unnamed protein product [Clonostachys solani]|uniref:FAD/NAD(P)-binding domain-containing protein n=1 Tax=Clonostachys solani TaxID=160281 RepID=A0A9N9Z730_9HYPO|nr:unnamed protein product [Clonostachys solani]